MQSPSGTAVVRMTLGTLLLATLAMALVQPVGAGSAEAPEIQDPRGDVTGSPVPAPCSPATPATNPCGGAAGFVDLVAGWVDTETETELVLAIDSGNNANVYGAAEYEWHFTVAGTEYVAGFRVNAANQAGGVPGDGAVSPTGVATGAEYVDTVLMITVPRSAIGSPGAGAAMSSTFLTSSLAVFGSPQTFSDRAPNADFGQDYIFTMGAGGPETDPSDTDGDGLNDTWETEYFGNITAQNATGDPDGDGLTNGQEEALGTDPTNPDTDGDGTNDKDDPFPLDPTQGGSGNQTSSTSTSTSRSTTSSSTSSTVSASVSTSATGGADDSPGTCADSDTSDAVDCLESDLGYLGMSAGGFLAVLVLCVVALATRWSL